MGGFGARNLDIVCADDTVDLLESVGIVSISQLVWLDPEYTARQFRMPGKQMSALKKSIQEAREIHGNPLDESSS